MYTDELYLGPFDRESQDGDETVIFNSMQALSSLQKLYGSFPRIVGKGDYAAVSIARYTSNVCHSSFL